MQEIKILKRPRELTILQPQVLHHPPGPQKPGMRGRRVADGCLTPSLPFPTCQHHKPIGQSCFVPKPRSTHRQICRKIQLNFPKKYFRKCLQSYELMNFNLTSHFPEHQPSDMRPIASTPPCGIKTTHRYKTRREGQPFLTVQVHVAGILMATLQKTTKGRY